MKPEFEQSLLTLTQRIEQEIPELGQILADGRASGADEATVLRQVMTQIEQNPSLMAKFEELAYQVLIPTVSGQGVRLEPTYEAAIQERIQFDGDVPELRTGSLPKNAKPAVPVVTSARNPIQIGWMLEAASESVQQEARQIEAENTMSMVAVERDALPDPVGYSRGQTPPLMAVEAPPGGSLAALTTEQSRALNWGFISTTQGRRSAAKTIQDLVMEDLVKAGLQVSGGDVGPALSKDVVVYETWTVDISGQASVQPAFSYVDTAAKALTQKILAQCSSFDGPLRFDVVALNTVELRKVGWAARLVRENG